MLAVYSKMDPDNGQFRSLLRYTAPARSEKGAAVSAGQAVKITRIVGTQFYVEATS